MNIKNLLFFNNSGYNMNLQWNKTLEIWEGNVYFPKVSVGLYANTNIYIMEMVNVGKEDETCVYPQANPGSDTDKIVFKWDIANTFVDEFFMFNFDENYYSNHNFETSSLIYTPNDGPELETLIVNRFDTYEVPLDSNVTKKPIPLHIAFSSPAKFDANTFKRTLDIFYNDKKFASITFFAETIEEDERLKVLNKNMGYNLKPEDTLIFKQSDIKESYPDYKFLNEKRKELMIEGHNIYPYIGSYKAIINVIKFFGYENLNIIEYWRNVDNTSENFGKIFSTQKYSLTNKETLNISGKMIPIPNRNYRKMNNISLVYTINHPIPEYDKNMFELPLIKEDFTFTLEEVLIKLFALRRKLNEEFMPASSRIVDIIGEATYFCLCEIMNGLNTKKKNFIKKKIHHPSIKLFPSNEIFTPNKSVLTRGDTEKNIDYESNTPPGFEFKTCYTNISDSRQFIEYSLEQHGVIEEENTNNINDNMPIIDIGNLTIEDVDTDQNTYNQSYDYSVIPLVGNDGKNITEYYESYVKSIKQGYSNEISYEPSHSFEDSEDYLKPMARVILENTSFQNVMFCQLTDRFTDIPNTITFDNIDTTYYGYNEIKWVVTHSTDQVDEDLKKIGVDYSFENKDFTYDTDYQNIDTYKKVLVELPFVGYYDIIVEFKGTDDSTDDSDSTEIKAVHTFKKVIKVEQYQPDIRGFYYDARSLPDDLQYDMDMYTTTDESDSEEINEYKNFILERLGTMTAFATLERITEDSDSEQIDKDQSMPLYGKDNDGNLYAVNVGPYEINYINQHWALLDNLNYDITTLLPNVRDARYIKNAVDVKPYTWFLLGYNESKITGVVNPHWKLTNLATEEYIEHDGKYLTLLLKEVGDYKVELSFEDVNGNKYHTDRTIVIVDENANYKLYKLFKDDYDAYIEAQLEREAIYYSVRSRALEVETEEDSDGSLD